VYAVTLNAPNIEDHDIFFNGAASCESDPVVTVTGYTFDWGDGTTSDTVSFECWHTYAADAGTVFDFAVTVSFSNLETYTQTAKVNLDDKVINLESTTDGLTVTVNGEATSSAGVGVDHITMDWEDSTASTGPFPQTHTYDASLAGYTRLVVVTAFFTDGSSVSQTIQVHLGSMFPVPETPFGVLAALGVGLAAFGLLKVKRAKLRA
jgi:phage baseplate assembly protein gpV